MKASAFALYATVTAGAVAGVSAALAHVMTDLSGNPGNRPIPLNPEAAGLPCEDVAFHAIPDGLELSGWLIPAAAGNSAVIFVPGGGLNRLNGDGEATLALARSLHADGHSVLLYDPRCTGRSEGRRSSYGRLEACDLVGALEILHARGVARERIGVLAWSMGAATAMFALERATFGALLVDSPLGRLSHRSVVTYVQRGTGLPAPFAHAVAAAARSGGFAAARLLWGFDLHRDPATILRAHPLPTMVIHGTADTQVPVEAGVEIAAAAGDALVAAHYPEGVEHIGAYVADPAWYARTTRAFFRDTLGLSPGEHAG